MSKRTTTKHTNVMKPSCEGVCQMVQALESRFASLAKFHMKSRMIPLDVPKSMEKDFIRWRRVAIRHHAGDLRHTEAEWESMVTIAQWTLDVNCELRNQEPQKLPSAK